MAFTQPWFEVNFGTAHAGLVGTVGYRLYQADDSDSVARTTAGIVEIGTNTGCYGVASVNVPDNAVGIEWDTGGGSPVSATEDIEPYRDRDDIQSTVDTNLDAQVSTRAVPGDEMTLEDDAITLAKFDETTAWPLQSADTGATQVARVGADGDTLETLSDQLDTVQIDLDNPNQYKADVSALAVEANVEGHVTDALNSYDPPTKGELDTAESNIITEINANETKIDALPTTAGIADAVWDEDIGDHLGGDKAGQHLEDADATADPATVATAVWSESLPGAFGAGEAGNIVGTNLDALISSRTTQADILSDATPFAGANIDQSLSDTEANIRGGTDTLDTLSDQLDTVQADLDDPNQYKADVSLLALEANVEGHATDALTAYDPPTRAEVTADKDEIIARMEELELAAETTVAAGSTATEVRTGLTQADDFFNNMQVVVINSAGTAVRNIDDFANTNGAITVDTLPFTPQVGDKVIILARTGSVPVDLSSVHTKLDTIQADLDDPDQYKADLTGLLAQPEIIPD